MKRLAPPRRLAATLAVVGAGAGVAAVFALDRAQARTAPTWERPLVQVKVDPDIGKPGPPAVRIERVRRSSSEPVSGREGPGVDTGLINFELIVTNESYDPVELDRIITKYNGLNAPIPSGWYDDLEVSDLMHDSIAFSADGNVITDEIAGDFAAANAGVALSDDSGDYVVAGSSFADAEQTFYVARHSNWRGGLFVESMPFGGRAYAVTSLPGFDPEPVFAAGKKGPGGNDQRAVVVRYATDDTGLALDPGFGGDGVVEVDVPFHSYDRITAIRPVFVGGQLYLMAAGTVTDGGIERPFLVRLRSDGTPDQSFGGQGIVLLPLPQASRRPVDLALRVEPGDTLPSIYVLDAAGGDCADEGMDCRAVVTRRRWNDGALDGAFGANGEAWVPFPDSLSDIPFGLELADGRVFVGATRMQQGSKAPWVALARLTADGVLDPAFGLFGHRVVSMDLLPVGGRGMVVQDGEIAVSAAVLAATARQVALFRFDLLGAPLGTTGNRQDPSEQPTVRGLAIDVDGNYVVFGTEVSRVQLTRFRKDGRLDWRGVLDPGESQRIRWPDDRELSEFPTSVTAEIYLREYILPYTVTPKVLEDAIGIRVPIQKPGELEGWRVSQHHRLRDDHRGALDQRYAYDFTVSRWSKMHQIWTTTRKDYDENKDPENTKYLAYGREVYAVRGGAVIRCWNAAPENQDPPLKTEYEATAMPAGGNIVDVLHDDGTVAHYSHFQPGSIPANLCPNTCTEYVSGDDDPWGPGEDESCNSLIEPASQKWIDKGTVLGKIGNAGNSTGPHLHFHVFDPMGGRPVYFYATKTEREVEPAEQNGAASLEGKAAAAPKLDDVLNVLYPE